MHRGIITEASFTQAHDEFQVAHRYIASAKIPHFGIHVDKYDPRGQEESEGSEETQPQVHEGGKKDDTAVFHENEIGWYKKRTGEKEYLNVKESSCQPV